MKNMKYLTALLIIAMLTGCFGQPVELSGLEGKPLPSFNLLLMDSSTRLNTSTVPAGQPAVFFYITPVCPYSRAQTEDIIANMKSLQHIRFYIVSNFPFNQIKNYFDHYQLKKYTNITVGQDYDSYFGNYFNVQAVPYMAIFDKEKKLKRVVTGKVGIDLVKNIALE